MPRSAGGDGWKKNVLLEDEDAADEVRERLDTEAERLEEEDRFAAADADNDGELEGEQEIAAGFRQAGEAQELTEDEDGDGVVDALDFNGVHNLIRDKDAVKLSADGVKRFSRKGTRECTDIGCVGLFMLYWVGMVLIALVALKGDYRRLLYGTDYNGVQCNSGINAGKEWVFYPALEQDLLRWYNSGGGDIGTFAPRGVCRGQCPELGDSVEMDGTKYEVKYPLSSVFFHCFPYYDGFQARLAICTNHSCGEPPVDASLPDDVNDGMVTEVNLGSPSIVQPAWSPSEMELNSTHEVEITTEVVSIIKQKASYKLERKDSSGQGRERDRRRGRHRGRRRRLARELSTCADYVGNCGGFLARNCSKTGASWGFKPVLCYPPAAPTNAMNGIADLLDFSDLDGTGRAYSSSEVQVMCKAQVRELYPHCTNFAVAPAQFSAKPLVPNPLVETATDITRNVKYVLRNIVGNIREILLCGGLCTLLLGFAWLALLRYYTPLIVYGTLNAVVLVELVLTLLLYAKAGAFGTHDPFAAAGGGPSTWSVNGVKVLLSSRVNDLQSLHDPALEAYFHWLAIATSLGCGVTAAWIMWMRPHLRVAIGIIQEAARMLQHLPNLFFPLPFMPVAALFLLMYYWLWIASYLVSLRTEELQIIYSEAVNATGAEVGPHKLSAEQSEQSMAIMQVYHFFGLLWTMGVIDGVWTCAVVGSVCHLYWTKGLTTRQRQAHKSAGCCPENQFPMLHALKDAMSYHFGSIVFGSCVIALAQLACFALEYAIYQAKKAGSKNAKVLQIVANVLRCIAYCIARCVKKMSENGYISVMMTGCNFVNGCMLSMRLLSQYRTTIVCAQQMGFFILHLTKVTLVATSLVAMLAVLSADAASYSYFPIPALFVTSMFSFSIASIFTTVYGNAIEALLFCYAADRELNDTNDNGTYAMSLSLYNFIHIEAPKHEFRDERTGYETVGDAHRVERVAKPNDAKLKAMDEDGTGWGGGRRRAQTWTPRLRAGVRRWR